LGDNARQHAPMTVEHQTRQPAAGPLRSVRLRALARAALQRSPPYARYRARQAGVAATIARLEADFEHVRERHTEQIERLEDLVRELVLSVESLRRALPPREDDDER
jgi:molecular chaperone GrpE (heat shock protein)